ncbi:MAG: DNA alkylation repair protein [Clostridia bacterium]|nr:DNA alkylation repair protein [Clostridia bacterium]
MIRTRLHRLSDAGYRNFQLKLMPTVSAERVVGVRVPELRNFAKEIKGSPEAERFLGDLPHKYYDEDNLHGMLISMERDYSRAVALLDEFLPYVDNWATCDLISPRAFAKHTDELLPKIYEWMRSEYTYEVRFSIGMLLKFYLDDATFSTEQAERVAAIASGEYYINMMRAWYFATALAKQYDAVIPFLEKNKLDVWTHNMTIRKAIESYRITDEQKRYLRRIKRL